MLIAQYDEVLNYKYANVIKGVRPTITVERLRLS